MKYKFIMLGCGSSTGVPAIENGWGSCDPLNSKNVRMRTSAYLEITDNNNFIHAILIDTSPDLRIQLLNNNIKRVDTVLFTHAHADHIYGLDDLRGINRITKTPINCYGSSLTGNTISDSFRYIFKTLATDFESEINRPSLLMNKISYNDIFYLADNKIKIQTGLQFHNNVETMGFVINKKVGYATDFHKLSTHAMEIYNNLDLLIISATVLHSHPSHTTLKETLELVAKLAPKQAVITHMSNQIDYETTSKSYSSSIIVGYDGLTISI